MKALHPDLVASRFIRAHRTALGLTREQLVQRLDDAGFNQLLANKLTYNKIAANNLRILRSAIGLNRTEFAKAIDCSYIDHQGIARCERLNQAIPGYLLPSIAKTLQIENPFLIYSDLFELNLEQGTAKEASTLIWLRDRENYSRIIPGYLLTALAQALEVENPFAIYRNFIWGIPQMANDPFCVSRLSGSRF